MAKTDKDTPAVAGTKYEATVFLLDPQGAKACIKAIGDYGAVEDIQSVTKVLYEAGYKPDGFVNRASSQVPAQAQGNVQAQPGTTELPAKFQDAAGGWWYINKSNKKAGSFYAARKNKATGQYEYAPKDQIPQYVRDAYGPSLA